MGRVLRKGSRRLSILTALSMVLAVVPVVSAPPAQAAISPSTFEQCLLDRANSARAAVGAPPLQMARNQVSAVRDWSEWMRHNDFEHMPNSRRQGILPDSWTTWGENIAMHSNEDMSDCGAFQSMWMNSAGHRSNILNPKFRYVAIGAYVDGSGWWATQLFFDVSGGLQCQACGDEIFFYRDDGLYRYYNIASNGTIGSPIAAGNGYTTGWDAITAIDLDGDGQDEMFFYRDDGLYRYYNIASNGTIGSPIAAGNGYTTGWDAITAVSMD